MPAVTAAGGGSRCGAERGFDPNMTRDQHAWRWHARARYARELKPDARRLLVAAGFLRALGITKWRCSSLA
jgi:hypothetical protein